MSTALNKGGMLVLFIIDTMSRKGSYFYRQQMTVIRHLHPFSIFVPGINHRILTGNLFPLERKLGAIHIETFPVLPDRIKQRPRHLTAKIRTGKFYNSGFNRIRRTVVPYIILLNSARTVTDNRLGSFLCQGKCSV